MNIGANRRIKGHVITGYRVGEDIEIEFIGLRPGEKMYEELLLKEEGLTETANKMIYIGKPIEYNADRFIEQLTRLDDASWKEEPNIRAIVKEIVPTYTY